MLTPSITVTEAVTGRSITIKCGVDPTDYLSVMRPDSRLAPYDAKAYILRTNFRSCYVRETPSAVDAMVRKARGL